MPNKRLFYAVQQVGFSALGENAFTAVHGLQSIGINTRFNLEQIYEIGQLAIYENIENIPDIEVSMEKVVDGYPLLYHLGTKGSTSATLSGRSNARSTVGLSVYSDDQESASGTPLKQCTMSGLYPSSVGYNFQINGPITESVSFVGNNKVWDNTFSAETFDNTDSPMAPEGVNQRQDVIFGESAGCSLLPTDIPGITASGTNPDAGEAFAACIQNINVQVSLGREQLFELGRRGPYHRYVSFPVEVRTDIEVLTKEGDQITALEEEENLTDQTIKICAQDSLVVNVGTKNKLTSANETGGNAGANGGNVSVTYSYITYNDFTVTHDQDPSGL